MTRSAHDTLAIARKALRALIALNWIFGGAILVLLVSTVVAEAWVARALGIDGDARLLVGGRLIMVMGIAAVPVAHAVFSRLLVIVDTVRSGDPFVLPNAARLRTIAWAVLGLELSRLVVAAIATAVSSPARPIHIERTFAVTPWLAVLLLFVLARVFEHGAQLRDDLAGTV